MYLDELRKEGGDLSGYRGRPLDTTMIESVRGIFACFGFLLTNQILKMSAEQLGQLYELMHASKDVWKSAEELSNGVNGSNTGKDG